ncbi:MCM2/3/5 family-domain-containing protein [Paraphysoderma sedebokerense]|nr:MCM2/3/5 family-domain-containing protein [Paraphysoderma sedebokerense]
MSSPHRPASSSQRTPHIDRTDPLRNPVSPFVSSSQRTQSEFSRTPRKFRGELTPSIDVNRYLHDAHDPLNDAVSPRQRSQESVVPPSNVDPQSQNDPARAERVIWGTTVNIQESMKMFSDFLESFTMADKKRAAWESSGLAVDDDMMLDDEDHEKFYLDLLRKLRAVEQYNLNLDCTNLRLYKPSEKLYHQLIKYPQEIIPIMDHVATELFHSVAFSEDERDEGITADLAIKVRCYNLVQTCNLRELNPSDIDQLVTVKGLLIRASPIVPDLKTAFFRCNVCDRTEEVEIDRGRIDEPNRCARCESLNCMVLLHNRGAFADKQLCRLQETPDMIPDGQTPFSVTLCCYDDLVDVAKPGDRLEVTGIYRSMPVRVNPRQRVIKTVYRTYIDVIHFKKTDKKRLASDQSCIEKDEFVIDHVEDDELGITNEEDVARIQELAQDPNIYERLAQSLAPSIYELDDVKKGVLLQMFGGTNKVFTKSAAPRYRGDINILLVGDPGVSKSQLLQYVHKIAPRGIYTSGKGSSAVGLTASVVRDPDTRALVLESGALVLSDGGVCCIDEFDKMSDATRAILHEVMEQQTVSIAKAGIITTLNARTSILASANPIHSKFNPNLSISENINLVPSLVSRFDLLYVILDVPNEDYDRKLARHLVSLYLEDRPRSAMENIVAPEIFTKYISYARNAIKPVITEEAGAELVRRYVEMRALGKGGDYGNDQQRGGPTKTISATTRQLESMIRLAEAHAKMRLSETVEVDDVTEAARLIKEAIKVSATDPKTGKIDFDLLATGQSTSAKTIFQDMKNALRDLITQSASSTMSGDTLLNALNNQSGVAVGKDEFHRALTALADDRLIIRNTSTNTIRRLTDEDDTDM